MLRSSDRPLPELGILRVKSLRISSGGVSRAREHPGATFPYRTSSQTNLGAAATHAARRMWLFLLPLTHEAFPAIQSKHRSASKALVLHRWSMLLPRDEKSAAQRRLLFTDAMSSDLDRTSGSRSQSRAAAKAQTVLTLSVSTGRGEASVAERRLESKTEHRRPATTLE